MPKLALDDLEVLIQDEEPEDENSVEYRRKVKREKKEIVTKKIRFYSREFMQE